METKEEFRIKEYRTYIVKNGIVVYCNVHSFER